MNAYKRREDPQHHLSATRIYVLTLLVCFIVVSIFLRFQSQSLSVTVNSPNMTQYEFLHQHYSASLSCSCTRSSINFYAILWHTIPSCDEYLKLNYMDIISLLSLENTKLWTDDDWLLLHIELSNVIQSCTVLALTRVGVFMNIKRKDLITLDVVDRSAFLTIINATFFNSFETLSKDINNLYNHLSAVYRANQFQNQYMTAWSSEFSTSEDNFIIRHRPTRLLNGTYCCAAASSNCVRPLVVSDDSGNLTTFPGID